MAYVRYVPEEQVPQGDRVSDRDNVIRIHGVHSRVMKHHFDLHAELMRGPGPLSRFQRELIALTVSAANGCGYCVEQHVAGLRRIMRVEGWRDADQEGFVAALTKNYTLAPLAPADRAMLDYAVKLSRGSSMVTADDIRKLRAARFDDRGIHDICALAAYFAFANRVADGLGVEAGE
ncbi:MAG: peroxidase-related enzyme [Gemmatimonadaceae bacterium]